MQPQHANDPADTSPIMNPVIDNTYGHYYEHRLIIESLTQVR
jgi:hypothetical protein